MAGTQLNIDGAMAAQATGFHGIGLSLADPGKRQAAAPGNPAGRSQSTREVTASVDRDSRVRTSMRAWRVALDVLSRKQRCHANADRARAQLTKLDCNSIDKDALDGSVDGCERSRLVKLQRDKKVQESGDVQEKRYHYCTKRA